MFSENPQPRVLKCEELGPKTAQRVLSKINKFLKQN
jgi:hypothetical protein